MPERARVNRQVLLKARPAAIPDVEHFEIVERPVPTIGDGQILVRNRYLSVDPAMRGWVSAVANYSEPVAIGAVMRSLAAGRVEESRHPEFHTSSRRVANFTERLPISMLDGISAKPRTVDAEISRIKHL
jgi:NADPH-dependent curcumin reductase CurA